MTITMMDAAHEGAYIRLLCYDWMNDGIPDDDAKLAAISRLGEGWFKGGSTAVKNCFNQHPTKDGFLTNPRLQIEREKQDEWREKSKAGGIKSAESRRKKSAKGGSTTVSRVVEPKGNTSSSSSSTIIPPLPPKGDGQDGFTLEPTDITPKPKRKRELTQAEKRRTKHPHLNPTMVRIGSWFQRQPTTLWTIAEVEALNAVQPTEKEIAGMEAYYLADIQPEQDIRRRDLATLLNNWNGELDRARDHYRKTHSAA